MNRPPRPEANEIPLALREDFAPPVRLSPLRRLFWWLQALLGAQLIALLVVQIVLAVRQPLLQEPSIAPLVVRLCEALQVSRCARTDIMALGLLDTRVTPYRRGLNATGAIVNRATFAQPLPDLELRFTDANGEVVSGRRFPRLVYLLPGQARTTMLDPGASVLFALQVEDPGERAWSYRVDLRPSRIY